jgi:hypothetical protein
VTQHYVDENLYPTEIERLEIQRLYNESCSIGSAVGVSYAELENLKLEISGLSFQKWQNFFIALLLVGCAIDTYFKNFGLGFNLGVWLSLFSLLQLGILTIKAKEYSRGVYRIKENLKRLDLAWAKIHGCVVNNDTFLLGELKGAVETGRFYSESECFMSWCDKEYDRIFGMVAGLHKLAEKNKPHKSRFPG